MYGNGQLNGFIGFDECKEYREWDEDTIKFLVTNTRNIESYLEKTQAQKELIKFKTIVDNANYGVTITDLDGKILYANNYLAKTHQKTIEELMGQDISILYDLNQTFFVNRLKTILSKSGGVIQEEVYHEKKDGTKFPMLMTGKVITDSSKKPLCFTSSAIDITREKEAEETIHQHAKMESIGFLAGGIAHDFNNILAGILGYAELIKYKIEGGRFSPEKEITHLDNIISASNRGSDLTSQLLGFSRQGQYNPIDTNPNEIVLNAYNLGIKQSHVQGINSSLNLSADNFIHADETQIYQVIQNLIINAIHVTNSKLDIYTEDVIIDNKQYTYEFEIPDGKYVQIIVEDDGCGIDEKILSKIFEPFFTTKPKGKGTGMGLAMVYGITNRHGGYINVKTDTSNDKHGTSFMVYFPAVKKHEISIDAEKSNHLGSGIILAIDDEQMIRDYLVDSLEMKGYKVVTATNGDEGFDTFRSGDFDLVLTDLIMPGGMDGVELCKKIREIDLKVPIYAMSGYQKDEKVKEMLKEGANGFLGKPFKTEELYKILQLTIPKN